jgi:hypothetical protein
MRREEGRSMVDEGPEGSERRFGKRVKLPLTVRVHV